MLKIIKAVIWNNSSEVAHTEDFDELKKHSILLLTASNYKSFQLSPELQAEWEKTILQQLAYNVKYRREQTNLPITVPFVILKGTSAAQYYPNPLYRLMGDIDIMTNRGEDFEAAYDALIKAGYRVVKNCDREIGLAKNGIIVEVHRYFASLNDVEKAKYLDDLIIENINPSHVLPDLINGLVILEHISQHLENGLGLRQIIDWMMFVHKCLPEDKWPEFQQMARQIGLEMLAIVSTRMCELYLGLPERSWCQSADKRLCEQLMDYVLACGNFGEKRINDSDTVEFILSRSRNPQLTYRLLQQRGEVNWEAAKKHPILRPFAWIYQAGRYLIRGLKRDNALYEFSIEYAEAKKRIELFEALGVKQTTKGLVVYKNGKYVKR